MSLIMRNLFDNDSWLEPSFDMIMYDPFREIDNRMRRQRMHRHVTPYFLRNPSSFFLNEKNLEQQLTKKNAKHWPQVSEDGKSVMVKFNLPDHVDPNKINVSTKDGNVIVKVEDKIEKENSTSEYSYYQRFSLPKNTDFETMKAFVDDNSKEFSIQASLRENKEEEREKIEEKKAPRQIPIQDETKQIKN